MCELRKFGPISSEWLHAAGFKSFEDVVRVGAVAAYRRVKDMFPHKVTLNLLWGLQAALMDIDWRDLPEAVKQDLRRELENGQSGA